MKTDSSNTSANSLPIVFYSSLQHSDALECFDCVSYGDASYTLIDRDTAYYYVCEQVETADTEEEKRKLMLLREEICLIPDNTYLALDG